MGMDTKKERTGKNRISRRVECLKSGPAFPMPDIYAEPSPIDRSDDDPADDSSGQESEGIDKSAGFNPYDTGTLYKK